MEDRFNEATSQRPKDDHLLDAPMIIMDLVSLAKQIKEEKPWNNSDRNAITIFKTNGMCIVLVALHAGAEMKTHTASGIISVQVLDGQITFSTKQQSVELGSGQMLALHEDIPHSVLAEKVTTFLLTIAKYWQ
ncbi:MAG TPA: cupin domain-containing protein [Mucilaginibacter sp.]